MTVSNDSSGNNNLVASITWKVMVDFCFASGKSLEASMSMHSILSAFEEAIIEYSALPHAIQVYVCYLGDHWWTYLFVQLFSLNHSVIKLERIDSNTIFGKYRSFVHKMEAVYELRAIICENSAKTHSYYI